MGASGSSGRATEDSKTEEDIPRVETGDQNAVKHFLDDAMVEYFHEDQKMKLHYGWDNIKLLLMVLAAALAGACHFFKDPNIPERDIMFICVAGFFVIQALLLMYAYFVEQDIVVRMSNEAKDTTILVRSEFPGGEDHYELSFEFVGDKSGPEKKKLYVGKFFDEEGNFDRKSFLAAVKDAFANFQNRKMK